MSNQKLRQILLGAACLAGLASPVLASDAGDKKPYWQDIQTVSVNREEPRTDFMTFSDRTSALNSRFEESPYYHSLNGTWKFYFVEGYKQLPANITDPSVDTSEWADIQVPGNWEVQGFGTAIYTNHGYEFKPRNPQPPTLPEATPVGVYRRDIDIPAEWMERDIYLQIAGAGLQESRRVPHQPLREGRQERADLENLPLEHRLLPGMPGHVAHERHRT